MRRDLRTWLARWLGLLGILAVACGDAGAPQLAQEAGGDKAAEAPAGTSTAAVDPPTPRIVATEEAATKQGQTTPTAAGSTTRAPNLVPPQTGADHAGLLAEDGRNAEGEREGKKREVVIDAAKIVVAEEWDERPDNRPVEAPPARDGTVRVQVARSADFESTGDALVVDGDANGYFQAGGQRGENQGKARGRLDLGDAAEARPAAFLPRKLYFENTYLGGDAAFGERVRRLDEALAGRALPHDAASGYDQGFDAPEDAGLALFTALDHRSFERPGRVILQVGLAGSTRCGWRRPPLDVVVVLDAPAVADDPELAVAVTGELAAQLGPQDHLAVVLSGVRPRVLVPFTAARGLRPVLAAALDGLAAQHGTAPGALAAAMDEAGRLLDEASVDRVTLPGTQTVLVVTRGLDADRVEPARDVAHALTLRGVVTSVIEAGEGAGLWWEVNAAGYGNYHKAVDPRAAVRAELDALSHVVARLVRVNIRLSPGVEAVRILGSRVLDELEVEQVKSREVAADLHISRTLGVSADRGDDDDGLQTVIPYFYGGDTHVILVELWVDRPGAVADVSLRYKDMVNLDNATARSSVAVRNLPREATGVQLAVARNARGFRIGEALENASLQLGNGDLGAARQWIDRARAAAAPAPAADRGVVDAFATALEAPELGWDEGSRALVRESLFVAARRKVGGEVKRR